MATATVCHACTQPCSGAYITALGHPYHEECFVCSACKKPFEGGNFLVLDDAAYCTQACVDACHARDTCFACKQPISVTVACISAGDTQKYHPDCFACTQCRKKLTDGKFVVHSDSKLPLCSALCLEASRGSLTLCMACAKPTAGCRVFNTDKGSWHAECFCCAVCGAHLENGSFRLSGEHMSCESCFAAAAAAGPAAGSADSSASSASRPAAASPAPAASATAHGSAHAPAAAADSAAPSGGGGTGGSASAVSEGVRATATRADQVKCTACGTAVEGGYVIALGRPYHDAAACFHCRACSKAFVDLRFAYWEDRLVCDQKCLDATLPLVYCDACHETISGAEPSLAVGTVSYHVHCFRCAMCGGSFEACNYEYIKVGDKACCCDECADAAIDQAAAAGATVQA